MKNKKTDVIVPRQVLSFFYFLFLWGMVFPLGAQPTKNARVEVAFDSHCEKLLLRTIKQAKQSIYVAAFAFTRSSIATALVERAAAGVNVQVKWDQEQAKSDFAERVKKILKKGKIKVKRIKMPAYWHMHHKFMVVDGQAVLTGSYNFTSAATQDNWENLVLIRSRDIAGQYQDEWERIRSKKK